MFFERRNPSIDSLPLRPAGTASWRPWVFAFVVAFAVNAEEPTKAPLPTLAFTELFESKTSELKASHKLLSLAGQRVRVVGFMAKMEIAPKGAFYLTPRPVSCDEEGGGTADLPPEAIYVIVRSQADRDIPHSSRALEVTGRLELGYRLEADGRATHIRLLLDQPQDVLGQAH